MLIEEEGRLSLVGLREEFRLAVAISGSVESVGKAFRGVMGSGMGRPASFSTSEVTGAGCDGAVELGKEGIRSIVSVQIALLCHLRRLVN